MKIATKLNANILQGVGAALTIASVFQPRHSPLEDILGSLGLALIWGGLAVHSYVWGRTRGYEKGHREARLIITEEVSARRVAEWTNKVWAEQAPPFKHEPALWEALSESRDAEDTDGTVWGTDYWGDIMSEPSEQQARALAQASASNVYTRQPHCEWELVSA